MAHFVAVAIIGATGEEKEGKGDKEKSGDLLDHLFLVLENENKQILCLKQFISYFTITKTFRNI